MRYQDGRAWIVGCPRCFVPVVEVHLDGIRIRMSRHAVPLADAVVLSKYFRIVANVWDGVERLYAASWHWTTGKPSRGHLYVTHVCGAFK